MELSSTEEEKSAVMENETKEEQLYTLEYVEDPEETSSEEFDSISSLDTWPDAHRLNDFDLEDRITQYYGWDPERKFSHIKYLKCLLGISNEGVREQNEKNNE